MVAAGVETRPATAGPGVPWVPTGYRAHLDGLRAVAVYLVVLFHAGSDWFIGGFVGVDVFFVLSGYLVTQVLLRDLESEGTIRFRRFYARRFRRLLPASFLALIVTALVFTAVASPAEVVGSKPAFQASFLYWANWYFIRESSDYFGDLVASNPVLHFWSLAVEEQFYVVWPLLLSGLVWVGGRLGRGRWTAVRVLVALGGLASVAWAVLLRADQPNRAYFGTDTRAYQLLLGALIALTPGLVRRAERFGRLAGAVAGGAVLALVVISSYVITVGPVVRGVAVALVAGVLIVALEARPRGFVARGLATRPAVYLGKVSYGTYLWHWPVIVLINQITEVGPVGLAAVAALLATGLASLSAALVELPIREAPSLNRLGGLVVASGLAISLVSGLLVIPRIMEPDRSQPDAAVDASVEGLTPVPEDFDQLEIYEERFGVRQSCLGRPASACVVHRGSGRHIMLMGDSNAQMLGSVFKAIAEAEDLTLSFGIVSGCPWQRGFYGQQPEIQAKCEASKEDVYSRVIPQLDPDLIVAINVRNARTLESDDYQGTPRDRDERRFTIDSVAELTRGGRDLLIIEPFPRGPVDSNPLDCLAKASFVEECRHTVSGNTYWLEGLEREIAARDEHVWTADFDRLACPLLPICDPVIDGVVVWWDAAHLAARFQATIVDDVTLYLKGTGLIPL